MVAPGGEDGFFEGALVRFGEEDAGATFATPGAVAWPEYRWVRFDEIFLLDGSEFDHGKLLIGIGEGGEDFSGDAEVGMVHVFALFGFWEAESDAAEVGWSGWHGALLRRVKAREEIMITQRRPSGVRSGTQPRLARLLKPPSESQHYKGNGKGERRLARLLEGGAGV